MIRRNEACDTLTMSSDLGENPLQIWWGCKTSAITVVLESCVSVAQRARHVAIYSDGGSRMLVFSGAGLGADHALRWGRWGSCNSLGRFTIFAYVAGAEHFTV